MAQVNKYDASHALAAVTSMAESVLDVLTKKQSIEANRYATDKQSENVRLTNLTNLEVAKMKNEVDREIAYLRANVDLVLKDLGIKGDRNLEILKHLNAKDRLEAEKALEKEMENLKHSNALVRIAEEFKYNLIQAEFNADEAMRRTLAQTIGNIYASAANAVSGSAKAALYMAAEALQDTFYNNWQRNWNDKMLQRYGNVVLGDKTLINFGGKRNVEENKPGWEMREGKSRSFKVTQDAKDNQQKTKLGRGFKEAGIQGESKRTY